MTPMASAGTGRRRDGDRQRQAGIAGILVFALLAPARVARAGDLVADSAEQIFQRGLADMLAGRYQTGCSAIAESLRVDPRPGTLFTLAECQSRAGRVKAALARYQEFLDMVAAMPADRARRQQERRQIASQQRDRLRVEIPLLTIVVAADQLADPNTQVQLDGVAVDRSKLGVALPVDPGEHLLGLRGHPRAPPAQRLQLALGDRKQVRLELVPGGSQTRPAGSGPPLVLTEDPLAPRSHRRRLSISLAIAGIVVAAAGGLALWHARNQVADVDRARANDLPYDESTASFRKFEIAGYALVAGGVATSAAGLALFFIQRRDEKMTAKRSPGEHAPSLFPRIGVDLGPANASLRLTF